MSSRDNALWSELVDLNRKVDGLVDRVLKKVRPTPAISREIVALCTIEVQWLNMPGSYTSGPLSTGSDAQTGNNVKRGIFTNKGSRLYIRELGCELFGINAANQRTLLTAEQSMPVPYFKWNVFTSITQRQYADKRVSAKSLGNPGTGSHLVFREPFVIEPMETVVFECELLSYGNFAVQEGPAAFPSFCISGNFFGYREGM